MLGRIVIDDLRPRTPGTDHPAKAVIGEAVRVSADVFRDGHATLAARVRWRAVEDTKWAETPMHEIGNDRWEGIIEPAALGLHTYVVEAWTDRFATWCHDVAVKHGAGQNVSVEITEGAQLLADLAARVPRSHRAPVLAGAVTLADAALPVAERLAGALDPAVTAAAAGIPDPGDLTHSGAQSLWVDRERALAGAWYELFPRSEGGLRAAADHRLSAVAEMGFDVVYLPPIHPIGHTERKGRDNTLHATPTDPGSPWAIGSDDGGHTAIEPSLGTIDDFEHFVARAQGLGMEVALDYALQCSPDHPWVKEHPEWFHTRADGSIQYAENPPKKYQDIYPINFWPDQPEARQALWDACKAVLDFWIGHGVRIFRVDNPHTKPLAFWEWLIPAVQADHPDVLFLAEAFTRPKMMAKLAEVGFSQSYTYFTWRNHKYELVDYLEELCHGPKADYMRPNFWPNTPDILSGPLRRGGPGAFRLRALLAATMVPSYGIYSGYELCENEPATDANEEYKNSEKYEIKRRDWRTGKSLTAFITTLNDIRRRHPAFAELRNIRFHHTSNDQVLAWSKHTDDRSDVMLMVVNLNPTDIQEDTLGLDLAFLGLPAGDPYEADDELAGTTFVWQGPNPYVRLNPARQPGHVLHLHPR
ncbi:MAG: alpha-1,4-glucan--maltose-1-phosphate maltosyltransferase [Actinomycetota bacterium]|nr:alpha-1,4-glucan--maltose-1-phosphate maltosyltransferase [Actinomycetota bacterium]